jgi:hypothetical protein
MADQLLAAIATHPLLTTSGTPLDPQVLFGDPTQGKTRVSVINFSGLGSDESRQSFVNQLQMALFTWIKKHPSPTGRLYALDEAQNFAPWAGYDFRHPNAESNRQQNNFQLHHAFLRQDECARDYPAVRELITMKGGSADDVAGLSAGVFYFATEGTARPIKLRAPLCLSYHPKNPLAAEEVVRMARP